MTTKIVSRDTFHRQSIKGLMSVKARYEAYMAKHSASWIDSNITYAYLSCLKAIAHLYKYWTPSTASDRKQKQTVKGMLFEAYGITRGTDDELKKEVKDVNDKRRKG